MAEVNKAVPKVRVSYDEMKAYLSLPVPGEDNYTEEGLLEVLQDSGITYGIKQGILKRIIDRRLYEQSILVAEGTSICEGTDGYFEYHFNTNPDGKPVIQPDGSVDYWSINKVELVKEGQLIATYHPAVQGRDGMTVKGKPLLAKRARELPPLKGKGFTRSEDNLTYVADFDGKIEIQNDRVMILQVYEIFGDADLSVGNIDFNGDVIVHGKVCSGVKIKAKGNIMVDGIVEVANLWAGKELVLRGGMMGGSRANVFAKGDISAKFFEYTNIEAEGDIQAEVFLNCQVACKKHIILSGRKAAIIGGQVSAIEGIETGNLGNEVEIMTDVRVGNDLEVWQRVHILNKKIHESQEQLARIEKGLKDFAKLEAANAISKDDPRKMQLLRVKIHESAILGAAQAEQQVLEQQIEAAKGTGIKVMQTAYPGVRITIDDVKYNVRDLQHLVEYKKYQGEVVCYPIIA